MIKGRVGRVCKLLIFEKLRNIVRFLFNIDVPSYVRESARVNA